MSACPSGWHLPSRAEWNNLVTAVGSSSNAGKKLKSQTGWDSYSGISSTDEFGFSALPGGRRDTDDGGFYNVGNNGIWWGATETGSSKGYFRYMASNFDLVLEDYHDKSNGYSVRCLMND
jgi:uncharacterized protein (TIGR02145 family)